MWRGCPASGGCLEVPGWGRQGPAGALGLHPLAAEAWGRERPLCLGGNWSSVLEFAGLRPEDLGRAVEQHKSISYRQLYYNEYYKTSDSYEVNTYNQQYLGYLETNGGCGVTGDLHRCDILRFGGLCGGGALSH